MLMPARAVLMDAAGHLFVQEELDDVETVQEYQLILEEGANTRGPGGPGGPGGRGGEYGGEYGGYGGEF
jgi:hypothetical protein